MSLAGLRDISVIETPPEGRRPVRTYVGPYDEELIGRAIRREVERGGQAFFLHNRIDSLHETAERLRGLCPGVRFAEAHGQMDELQLEATMLSFVRGEHDCLVATTIIESGIDIPSANTLIVGAPTSSARRRRTRSAAGGPQPGTRVRLHALSLPELLTADGRPPGHALRQHRAGLGLPRRNARPRDPRRRQPARRRAAISPPSASSSTARCSRTPPRRCGRGSRRGRGSGPSASPYGSSSTWTPTCRATTSPGKPPRSTCTGGSPRPASAASCARGWSTSLPTASARCRSR